MYVFMCLHLSLHTGDAPLDIYIFGNQLTPVSTTTRVERAGKASQEVTLKCGETHTTKHSSVGVLNAFRDSFCEAISIFCANFFFPHCGEISTAMSVNDFLHFPSMSFNNFHRKDI